MKLRRIFPEQCKKHLHLKHKKYVNYSLTQYMSKNTLFRYEKKTTSIIYTYQTKEDTTLSKDITNVR